MAAKEPKQSICHLWGNTLGVKEIDLFRQAGGAGEAGEAKGEKKAYLNRIDLWGTSKSKPFGRGKG